MKQRSQRSHTHPKMTTEIIPLQSLHVDGAKQAADKTYEEKDEDNDHDSIEKISCNMDEHNSPLDVNVGTKRFSEDRKEECCSSTSEDIFVFKDSQNCKNGKVPGHCLSPAAEREKQRTLKIRNPLSKLESNQIKSGWKVRRELSELTRNQAMSVNTVYLQTVASGSLADLQALFSCCKFDNTLKFDRNCVNQHEKGALRLAIENNDTPMCEFLLSNKINISDNIFHAIKRNFIEGVETILKCNPCIDSRIDKDNYYFTIGMTPMILASLNNNYDLIKLLYGYGHRLEDSVNWWDGIHFAWESSSKRVMMCKAKASPAYITFICEIYHKNPMEFCLKQIKELRKNGDLEQERSDVYKELEEQLEEYMCSLLDQIQSSDELAQLFQYNFIYDPVSKSSYQTPENGAGSRKDALCRMELLDTASKHGLVRFVTHPNSQLALSYIRYRCAPFLKEVNSLKRALVHRFLGLMFPFLSIFYLISPKSKLGGIITLPNVSFECHMMSDFVFIALLVANVTLKSEDNDYLGASPTALEWLIVLWVLGKWIQEIRECQNRGIKNYAKDWWNYNDMIQFLLFASVFTLRAIDYVQHRNAGKNLKRAHWEPFEPRLVSSGLLAWAYVFVFLRVLSLTRTNKILGPLQVSLAKMLVNVVQFLCIFGLMMFAFALGLSEIYWYYGTPDGIAMLCDKAQNSSVSKDCSSTIFVGLGPSLEDLFWALFGQIELSQFSLNGKHPYANWIGHSLVATYHIVAIIILLNMLIAMMAKSFEATSENKETEWKFHRTVVWLRYIRREFTRPPPMNLLPSPYFVHKQIKMISQWLRNKICSCCTLNRRVNTDRFPKRRKNVHPCILNVSGKVRKSLKRHMALSVLFKLMQRFKFNKLLDPELNSQAQHVKCEDGHARFK